MQAVRSPAAAEFKATWQMTFPRYLPTAGTYHMSSSCNLASGTLSASPDISMRAAQACGPAERWSERQAHLLLL